VRRSDLTAAEQTNVRTALKFLRTRCGSWVALAKVLGIGELSLASVMHSRRAVSASLTFRVARLAKVSVDDVLAGRFPAEGTCPYCGHCPSADEVTS
jgi:hypothetical protein